MKFTVSMTAILLLCLLTGCAINKDKVKYAGNCGGEGDGSNLKWTLTKTGTLTISGKGKMTDGELPWNTFYGELHEKVKRVVLKDGITYIGHGAFYSCGKITGEVIIPDTLKVIGPFAFYECDGIESITLPANLERIEDYAFRGCSGWKGDINLPQTITFIGEEAFENCEGLTGELRFSDHLTAIGRCAFIRCRGLTGDLILPDSLEVLGDYAFSQCENLHGRLKLSEKLTVIEPETFSYAGLSGDLVIPDGVTEIGERAFDGCNGLNGTLILGDGVGEIKTSAFWNTGFTEIKFGDSLTFIGSSAFSDNAALSGALNFPAALKYIGMNAFGNCPNINEINLQEGLEVIADGAFTGVQKAGNTVELPASIWYIGQNDSAFKDSCFEKLIFKGERESDKEYQILYTGSAEGTAGSQSTEEAPPPNGGGFGDMAFVWIPNCRNLIGFNGFADTWLNFDQDVLHICRSYCGKEVRLADIPVSRMDSDHYLYRTEEPFEYKGFTFQEFQFVRWVYDTEVCMAYVKDQNGQERTSLFGDLTEAADSLWSAYTHPEELMAASKE